MVGRVSVTRRSTGNADTAGPFAIPRGHSHVGGGSRREDPTNPTRSAWWRQVFEVADEAFEASAAGRAIGTAHASAGDACPVAAAARLLENGRDATFLETPAVEFAGPLLLHDSELSPAPNSGVEIGPYRILRLIGEGGMGTVYLAERADDQYEKLVALKVLPTWRAGDARLVRRFREERQILAALDHPDIAHLYDGGVSTDGRPWFALEYVNGVPIDRFCDDRELPLERRLELFCRVCAAVQYAHRNLVVHRDLKPANVLVTPEGRVKLLDFGIAKLLEHSPAGAASSLTMPGERLMTPLYASPEQVAGAPISTASDVYSLGVLLFELLTGRSPYRLSTKEPHEVARAVLEQELPRPSAVVARIGTDRGEESGNSGGEAARLRGLSTARLARRLRGDLDTIVLTALERDPAKRYGGADQLEADVRRHLRGMPVSVHPETTVERSWKFVKRHRVGVLIASAATATFLAFAGTIVVQALRIRAQASRITVERDNAEQAFRFLAGLFQGADPFAGVRRDLAAREILDSGAARIDRELADQPESRARMTFEMGRAYFGLGLHDRARRLLEVTLWIQRRAIPPNPADIATTLDLLGLVRLAQGELDDAERASREALLMRRRVEDAAPGDVARTLNGLARVLHAAGRYHEADSVSREALSIDERQSTDPLDRAESLKGLAHALHELGDYPEAEQRYRTVLALQARHLSADHPEAINTLLDIAATIGMTERVGAADSLFRRGLARQREALGDDHPSLARDHARYARLLHRRGELDAAETLYRRSLGTLKRRLPSVHPLTATTLLGLGELMLTRGAAESAEPVLREALAIRRTTLPAGHPGLAEAEQGLGAAIMARSRFMEAERYLLASREGFGAAYGDSDRRTRAVTTQLIRLYESSSQPERAARMRRQLESPSTGDRAIDGPPTNVGIGTGRRAAVAGRDRSDAPRDSASHAPGVDRDRILVFPMSVNGAQSTASELRDAIQDALAARLSIDESIVQAHNPPFVQRASDLPVETPGVRLDEAVRTAARLGAQRLVLGEVGGTADDLSIRVELVGVKEKAVRASAEARGSADSLSHLVNRLVVHLLSTTAARDSAEAVALAGRPLPALRAYLAGLSAYGRGRLGVTSEATTHFERALFLDSTFALAALRLAEIGVRFGSTEGEERWKIDAAWNLRHRLGPADRALLDAYLGPRYPLPATLAELVIAARRATEIAPHRAESWRVAGVSLLRFGPRLGHRDWHSRSREALERAHAAESTDVFTLQYLLLLAALRHDSAGVRRYATLHDGHGRMGGQQTDFIGWIAATAMGDSARLQAVRARLGEASSVSLQSIVEWSQTLGIGLDDADVAARVHDAGAASASQRRTVVTRLAPFLLNRGRATEAGRLLATSERGFGQRADVGVLEFQVYSALYWDGIWAEGAAAARDIEKYLAGGSVRPGRVRDAQTASCALAHWRISTGDLRGAQVAFDGIRRIAAAGKFEPVESGAVCAAAVEARLAAARRRPEASIALARLDTLLQQGSAVEQFVPTVATVIAARLYEDRGDLARALELSRRRTFWWNWMLSTPLRDEGRLAAQLGDRAGAIRAYRHYVALRRDADPALREEVARVRQQLATLEAQAPGDADAQLRPARRGTSRRR